MEPIKTEPDAETQGEKKQTIILVFMRAAVVGFNWI
jgi:hypothetical protein